MPEGLIRPPEIPSLPPTETGPAPVETSAEQPTPGSVVPPAPAESLAPVVPVTPVQPNAISAPPAAELHQTIEHILVEGLEETYRQLDPITQVKFKTQGEQTATALTTLLTSAKVQMKKVVELIIAWLKILPGVNRFFLEQEAKIKADKLLALRRDRS